MENKTKWIILIIALVLIFGNFKYFKEDASSFVPMSLDESQISPSAKYQVIISQQTQPQTNLFPLLGFALLLIIVFSDNKYGGK